MDISNKCISYNIIAVVSLVVCSCGSLCLGLNKEYETLQKKAHNKGKSIADLLAYRKKFETDVEAAQAWMNEAEVALSAELRTTSLDLIQEQLNKVHCPHNSTTLPC